MKYNHGDAMLCGSLALMFASPWLRPLQEDLEADTADIELLDNDHQSCEEARCPCGFKLNLAKVNAKCQGPTCDWHDRDICCVGDFDSGDYPPCYGLEGLEILSRDALKGLTFPQYIDEELVSAGSRRPEGWPQSSDEFGVQTPITSPMMREMAMDAYRGCTEAFGCEDLGGTYECGSCVSKHCKGLNSTSKRPKAAPWYPKSLSKAPEQLIYQFTCDACFLTDLNGRGDGRKGCSGVDDWLASCETDTPNWRSHDGKTCVDYQLEMSIQNLFRNDSLKSEVKTNCCRTWTCTKQKNCPVTTTTTTTLPPLDLSLCPFEDGCHETRRCPCHMFVSQIMGYDPWADEVEERKVRANCCDSVKIYERVKAETVARKSKVR